VDFSSLSFFSFLLSFYSCFRSFDFFFLFDLILRDMCVFFSNIPIHRFSLDPFFLVYIKGAFFFSDYMNLILVIFFL
ncbi:hypothetical protein DFH28DRAFT_961953, partial [Melampsora americana]